MALDRIIPNSTTPGTISGDSFMDATQEELTGLWNYSRIPLSVSGTNTLTATPSPALTGALVDGMGFVFRAQATNTSTSMTLNVGTGAFALLTRHGVGPAVGSIVIGGLYEAIWVQGAASFMLMSYLPAVGYDDRPSFRNIIGANGGCEIWQRGTAIGAAASTSPYTCDRWYISTGSNQASTVSRAAFGDQRSEFCAVVQRNNGQTGTGGMLFGFPLTLSEVVQTRGQQVTMTARLAPGANWSPTSGVLNYGFSVGTGSEKKLVAGFTSQTNVIVSSIVLSGTLNISNTSASTVPTNATQGEVWFAWTPVGTAGAQDWFVVDDVQLECGTVATQFEYVPFDYSLRLCQAHYAKTFPYGTAPAQAAGLANAISSDKDLGAVFNDLTIANNGNTGAAFSNKFTSILGGPTAHWRFPARMRTTPTITTFNPSAANANWRLPTGNSGNPGATAVDSTLTVSPHSSGGDHGVTFTGEGATVTNVSAWASTSQFVAYVHATADAGL